MYNQYIETLRDPNMYLNAYTSKCKNEDDTSKSLQITIANTIPPA